MTELSGRPAYSALPVVLQRWVEKRLGSTVASATTQPGGFSPGVAARLVSAEGARAFVKAIATGWHANTASLHRYEVSAMEHIPPSSMLPGLYDVYDDGEWVALLLEDIEGRHPIGWVPEDVSHVALAIDNLTTTFTPTPWPDAQLLARSPRVRTRWWAEAEVEGAPEWVSAHQSELVGLEERVPAAVRGDTLCHRDLMAENILITPTGRVVFLDWAWASQGPSWTDTMHLACTAVAGGTTLDVDALLARQPHTRDVDPGTLTAYLANLAGSAYVKSRRADPQSIPALQAYRRSRADALLGWLRHRTGW